LRELSVDINQLEAAQQDADLSLAHQTALVELQLGIRFPKASRTATSADPILIASVTRSTWTVRLRVRGWSSRAWLRPGRRGRCRAGQPFADRQALARTDRRVTGHHREGMERSSQNGGPGEQAGAHRRPQRVGFVDVLPNSPVQSSLLPLLLRLPTRELRRWCGLLGNVAGDSWSPRVCRCGGKSGGVDEREVGRGQQQATTTTVARASRKPPGPEGRDAEAAEPAIRAAWSRALIVDAAPPGDSIPPWTLAEAQSPSRDVEEGRAPPVELARLPYLRGSTQAR